MNFTQALLEDQRLFILRVLDELPGFSSNVSALQSALDMSAGHRLSRDAALALVDWLDEVGLVTKENLDPRICVVKLTQRGSDVAQGRAHVTGVKRPRPGV